MNSLADAIADSLKRHANLDVNTPDREGVRLNGHDIVHIRTTKDNIRQQADLAVDVAECLDTDGYVYSQQSPIHFTVTGQVAR